MVCLFFDYGWNQVETSEVILHIVERGESLACLTERIENLFI